MDFVNPIKFEDLLCQKTQRDADCYGNEFISFALVVDIIKIKLSHLTMNSTIFKFLLQSFARTWVLFEFVFLLGDMGSGS